MERLNASAFRLYILTALARSSAEYASGSSSCLAFRWSITALLCIALFFFKYWNFTAENLGLPTVEGLLLPIGISFYTFQILSYTVDLYREEIPLQKSFVSFGTYVTLFPQLVAGPIVRYREVDDALTHRRESLSEFAAGVQRFCCGLGKKVLIGDALWAGHRYFQQLAAFTPTALGAWLNVILYTLHLYFDFSGYSDMAIGLGQMLGFSFPENFKYPYISQSITEFWRRWHITLSSWFREYVYIPLGGNRRGGLIKIRNLAVVWVLTGVWHGAAWNFVLWGVYFFVILTCEHLFLKRVLEKLPRPFRHVYTLLLVVLGFLIFSNSDLGAATACLGQMVGIGTVGFSTPVVRYQLWRLLPLLVIAAVGATPLPRLLWDRAQKKAWQKNTAAVAAAALLVACTAYLVSDSFCPFAYLNF